jgi:hypothetical protein
LQKTRWENRGAVVEALRVEGTASMSSTRGLSSVEAGMASWMQKVLTLSLVVEGNDDGRPGMNTLKTAFFLSGGNEVNNYRCFLHL